MVPPWCRSARSSICSLRTLLILEGFAYFSLICRIENLGEGISSFQEILRVVSKPIVGVTSVSWRLIFIWSRFFIIKFVFFGM